MTPPAPQYPADLPCFRCTFTQEFHDTVIENLASLTAGNEAIIARLDRINGSVAKLFQRTDEHATALAILDTVGSKPTKALNARLDKLDRQLANDDAKSKGVHSVVDTLKPVIWAILGAIGLLLAKHADVLLTAIGK